MGSHELVCQRAFSWSFSASPSSKEALSEIWPMDYVFSPCSRSRRDVHVCTPQPFFILKFFLVLKEEVPKCFPRTTVGFLFAATVIPNVSLRNPLVFPCVPW